VANLKVGICCLKFPSIAFCFFHRAMFMGALLEQHLLCERHMQTIIANNGPTLAGNCHDSDGKANKRSFSVGSPMQAGLPTVPSAHSCGPAERHSSNSSPLELVEAFALLCCTVKCGRRGGISVRWPLAAGALNGGQQRGWRRQRCHHRRSRPLGTRRRGQNRPRRRGGQPGWDASRLAGELTNHSMREKKCCSDGGFV
jgi:hypothetical protein